MAFLFVVGCPFGFIYTLQIVLGHLRFDPFWYGHDVAI